MSDSPAPPRAETPSAPSEGPQPQADPTRGARADGTGEVQRPSAARETARPHWLVSAAALVIVVAGLRAAGPVIVPLLLAGFIAVLCLPLLDALLRRRVPAALAVTLVLVATVLALGAVAGVVGSSVSAFSNRLPFYQTRFAALFADLQAWLGGLGVSVSLERLRTAVDPSAVMQVFSKGLLALAATLSNGLLVLLVVVFLLGEAVGFPAKLRLALASRSGGPPADDTLARLTRIVSEVQRYLAYKSLISLGTGVAVGLWCWLLGVDFPFLWGLVAFLLNFVPNIGSLLAAAPPVLLALVQLGPGRALLVAAGYLGANFLFGNVLEPLVMGRKLGLSSLVVFLSLIGWGFVWGPVGMLLSVPLTVIVRIALEASPSTRPMAVLLGPAPEPGPRPDGAT